MKFIIKHEVKGRLRIHVIRNRMTCAEADILCWTLEKQEDITSVKVYERTADAVIYYTGDRGAITLSARQNPQNRYQKKFGAISTDVI